MLKVRGAILVCVGSIQLGHINTFWDRKLCIKTWNNSKIFMNFANFSCVIFWTQNVLISPIYY